MTTRESVYMCTFAAPDGPRRAFVRAWTTTEARETLARDLRDEGLEAREIHVEQAAPRGGSSPGH